MGRTPRQTQHISHKGERSVVSTPTYIYHGFNQELRVFEFPAPATNFVFRSSTEFPLSLRYPLSLQPLPGVQIVGTAQKDVGGKRARGWGRDALHYLNAWNRLFALLQLYRFTPYFYVVSGKRQMPDPHHTLPISSLTSFYFPSLLRLCSKHLGTL